MYNIKNIFNKVKLINKYIRRVLFFIFQVVHYPFYRYAVLGAINNDRLIFVQRIYILFYKILLSKKIGRSERYYIKETLSKRDTLRVGFLAPFSCNSSFTPSLLFDVPNTIELFVYDLEHDNVVADFLADRFNYRLMKTTIPEENKFKRVFGDAFDYNKLASMINDDMLDVFIFVTGSIDLTLIKLIEEVHSEMFIAANTGSAIFPHDKVTKQLQIQLSPGYEIINNKLFSFRKNDFIYDSFFYNSIFPYDSMGIETQKIKNKNKKMFMNARLSKFSNDYLKAVALLLRNDRERSFYFMGREREYLPKIKEYFRLEGVLSQVHYLGEFFSKKSPEGVVEDKNWNTCMNYLSQAEVILGTFPVDSGSSKIEAFLSYTPVVSMGVKKENYKNNAQHHYIGKLQIPKLTANNLKEYILIAENILDGKFDTTEVCEQQLEIGKKLTDNKIFWKNIMEVIND